MPARLLISAALVGATAQPALAEVIVETDRGFVTRDEAVVDATTKEVWLALIAPGKWWSSAHTWSGDAGNMTITPQAGGCFCERIPEDPDPDKITLEGSVEHMRVIQSYPERALRLNGALGPLQSEPVNGILTIAMSEVDTGTRIVWEYAVGGEMRFEIPVISKAVDGVMTQQLAGLAQFLGPVSGAGSSTDEASGGESEVEPEAAEPNIDVDEAPLESVEQQPAAESEGPSVDEAFGDLLDDNPET